jgi:pimeloyl-ACP methyl ester carboxylesterase
VGVAPEWFERSIATPYDSRFVEVAGCSIHYLSWGDRHNPGLLLLPGTGGHAHWFSHIAPLFADQFHVVSMDIAGCGDSGMLSAAVTLPRYGERTHLADHTLYSRMMAVTNGEVPVFTIPGSSHYPMIDNPLAFVGAIKGIALAWIAAARRYRSREAAHD